MASFDDPNNGDPMASIPLADIKKELERVERLISPQEAQAYANALTTLLVDEAVTGSEQGLAASEVFRYQRQVVYAWLGYVRSILKPLEGN